MEVKHHSAFKNPAQDKAWLENWVKQLERLNQKTYQRIEVGTSLGKTCVWGIRSDQHELQTLVIFPGARTSVLFWDFDNNLKNLGNNLRIFLVETNGLPNLSDGNTPDIKTNNYGIWASEVFDGLNVKQAYISGASFGGLIAMKMCITNPKKVKAAFLLNPGCLQPFSLSLRNLYYNLLPIVSPTPNNVSKFLEQAVFCKPTHTLSEESWKLIVDYEVFALTRFRDNTQKPYYMHNELMQVSVDTYLLIGDQDLLFPHQRSITNAKEKIPSLKEVIVFNNVAHGIETFPKALRAIRDKIEPS